MNLYIRHELNFYSVESVIDDEYLVRETDGYSIWQRVEARFNVKRLLNSVQDARRIILYCATLFFAESGVVYRCLDEDLFTRVDNTRAFLSGSSFVWINFDRRKRIFPLNDSIGKKTKLHRINEIKFPNNFLT